MAGLPSPNDTDPTSLIAQLVADNRPDNLTTVWPSEAGAGDRQQMQICRIVDETRQSATAEGLFYQLIVRLHKYSLGRGHYDDSVHWQRGLVLDNDYNGRALLEHKGNDVHITVRAAYPQGFLTMLTEEVKYLVESFWEGLRCDVMVRCLNSDPCQGLFEVSKLIENARRGRPEQPCPICNEWQTIDTLLRNAPAAQPLPANVIDNRAILAEVRQLHGRFDQLDKGQATILSQADAYFYRLIRVFTDEAKEGPRLFSLVPIDRTNFNPREWATAKFRLTLWCEHSRTPLPALNGAESQQGVYEIELTRTWFKKAAPVLKAINVTLSLVLPVATSGFKLEVDDDTFADIEEQLDFGTDIIDASMSGGEAVGGWLRGSDTALPDEYGEEIRAHGATLRQLHSLLKEKDPSFGGLVRVRNKRQEFLWVHEQFEGEY